MHLSSLLPDICLPPFHASRVGAPTLEWANSGGLDGISLEQHAYFIPFKDDLSAASRPERKIFRAERYGGQGIGANGGGVRCGLEGKFQIKGIGRNQLAGPSTDFFHSYGGASLNEGIVEAIWGEILHAALPHGAARIYGLIGTGTRVPLLIAKQGCDPTTARALIVRQAVLRPAHFMRAIYYDPMIEMQHAPKDALRTRAAVARIVHLFEAIYGCASESASTGGTGARLNWYLDQMFGRFAAQIARARAKRIMHGSLTESNLALDGRWLDFGTTSAMPVYGRILISPGSPDFLNEESVLQKMVLDLLFYLDKYVQAPDMAALDTPKLVWARFKTKLDAAVELEFLKLSGIPVAALEAVDPGQRRALYLTLKLIVASGNSALHSSLGGAPLPEKTGNFDLSVILSRAVLCATPESADAELQDVLWAPDLRAQFVRQYWQFRAAYFDQLAPTQRGYATEFMILNCLRVNLTIPALFRPNLYRAIEQLLLDKGNVTTFIDQTIRRGSTLLRDPQDGVIDLSDWFDQDVSVSAAAGIRVAGAPCTLAYLMPLIRPGLLSAQQIQKMVKHA